jgi:hypothetical protein
VLYFCYPARWLGTPFCPICALNRRNIQDGT